MDYQGNRKSIFAPLFLIGLGVIALFNFWWPGIMFVLGFSLIASEIAEKRVFSLQNGNIFGGLIVIAIGALSILDIKINWSMIWPVVLITIGLLMLVGHYTSGRK